MGGSDHKCAIIYLYKEDDEIGINFKLLTSHVILRNECEFYSVRDPD